MSTQSSRSVIDRPRDLVRILAVATALVIPLATSVSTTGLHFNAAKAVPRFPGSSVPEPASIGLLAVGAAGVATVMGLRRSKIRRKDK